MLVDLNQVRAADYAKAGFFQAGEMPRPGIDGYYALAISRRLKEAGISPQEFVQFCERLANQLEPGYDDAEVSAGTRAALRTAGAQWKERCAALAELFDLAIGVDFQRQKSGGADYAPRSGRHPTCAALSPHFRARLSSRADVHARGWQMRLARITRR